jgi:predicted phosphodiesterase
MRYLVISDIHGNLTAFQTVLKDAEGDWDFVWCLGDVVGYGPDPNECVALLREQPHICLSGNHDWAVLGRLDLSTFNPDARNAIAWAQGVLSDESRAYLEALPSKLVEDPFTLAHASPRQPVWEYIIDRYTALANFEYLDTQYCLVGHTHVPIVFEELSADEVMTHGPVYQQPLPLNGARLIINPGSVGQPRDHDPRAAYAILDTDQMTWEHRRVAYAIAETQERMSDYDLPYRLIARLDYGL